MKLPSSLNNPQLTVILFAILVKRLATVRHEQLTARSGGHGRQSFNHPSNLPLGLASTRNAGATKERRTEIKMELTKENKQYIDDKSYEGLLFAWRNAPSGSPWFQGATGTYWAERMAELRAQPEGNAKHVAASKSIGW